MTYKNSDLKPTPKTNKKGEKLTKKTCCRCKEKYLITQKDYEFRLQNVFTKKTCFNSECLLDTKVAFGIKQAKLKKKAFNKKLKQDEQRLREKWNIPKKKAKHQEPLQKAINELVRLLDKDKPCYVYPHYENGQDKQAGHVFGIGKAPHLRYLLLNVFGESIYSNVNQNIDDEFKVMCLERLHGEQAVKALRWIRKTYDKKLTKVDKDEKLGIVRQIIREVKKGAQYSRRELDDRIGIYDLPEFYEEF